MRLAIADTTVEKARLWPALATFDAATTTIQWRDKRAEPDWALAEALREACLRLRLNLVANLATEQVFAHLVRIKQLGFEAIHLGESAETTLVQTCRRQFQLLTRPAHDDDGIKRAIAEGADAVLVSPIFAVPGKGPARGLEALRSARALVTAFDAPLVIYALGGVTEENRASCIEAGADGTAAIRSAW